jgi:phage terminase large subunit-like protein
VNPIDAYAFDVAQGRVPAGKYHRLSCERHIRDRARENTPEFPYVFKFETAERFFRLAERLKHYKGEWAGQPIALQPYQQFRLGSIFAWIHQGTGLRRFRTAYNELPRKSGKSLEAAVVAIYTTFFDKEPGAEGYTTATKLAQAQIVWSDARKLVRSSGLKNRIGVRARALYKESSASKLEALSAGHESLDGLNPHLIIIDEFHAHKDRGLIDVLETATGARRQPLKFYITTAGNDPVSPCGDEHQYACQILDQVVTDETYFAFIAHAEPTDDWTDERTWAKANPNWNVSVKPDDMRALATKAKAMPSAAATFKQKRLNLWVAADAVWLSIDGWRKGQTECPTPEAREAWVNELVGQPCWVGLDNASKLDLLALVFVFPPFGARTSWRLLPYVWTPEATLRERAHRDRAPYELWVEQGYLRTTPGTQIDDTIVIDVLKENRRRFKLQKLGVDPWHIGTLRSLIIREGWKDEDILDVPQTFAGLSKASQTFEADVLAGEIDAAGDPLMQWCVSNVVANFDGKNNIVPIKKKSRGRIDPVVAALDAEALYLKEPVAKRSKYETQGLATVGGGDQRQNPNTPAPDGRRSPDQGA